MGKFDFIEADKRILDQKLRRHQISQQEYLKTLKNAPDEKGYGVEMDLLREKDSEPQTKSDEDTR